MVSPAYLSGGIVANGQNQWKKNKKRKQPVESVESGPKPSKKKLEMPDPDSE